ncbi:MAG: saccharopine dehydrogenase NADP-binding domain-containing protein [Ignavibacteria bacterium]|jgi:saccharopine dehydrogenase (NAD+, L-lysine-forming)
MPKKIFILGGYGNTGYLIADYLLKETDVQIAIAGRDIDKASIAAYQLNDKYRAKRTSSVNLSASDYDWIKKTIEGYDYLVLASSTSDYVENVVKACLATNTNYFDTQFSSPEKIKMLRRYESEIDKKGLTIITDGGYHPGVISALIRYAGTQFDKMYSAFVYSFVRADWRNYKFSKSTLSEFMSEIKNYNPTILKKGKWKRIGPLNSKEIYFDREIGVQKTASYYLEELSQLPELLPNLKNAGFYAGGVDWFTKDFTAPIGHFSYKIFGDATTKPLVKIFKWGNKKFSKPPYKIKLKLIAEGISERKNKKFEMSLEHKDGYFLTAIPVVITISQILKGIINPHGLCFQANIVEPAMFFEDMEKLGININ